MAEPCGCRVAYKGSRMKLRQVVIHCPMHAAVDDLLAALEPCLRIARNYRRVIRRVDPSAPLVETDRAIEDAQAAIEAAARSGAPRPDAEPDIVGAGQESPVWRAVLGQQE